MLIKKYPFTITIQEDIARPYLPITIINPENQRTLNVFALIDTGADECAFPASFAEPLEHNVLIDFMLNLYVPLLGVKNFLNKFILEIDYPNKVLSII